MEKSQCFCCKIFIVILIPFLFAGACNDGKGGSVPGDVIDIENADINNDRMEGGGDVCVPQCDGKECGPDGCGGECGTCSEGVCSLEGKCIHCSSVTSYELSRDITNTCGTPPTGTTLTIFSQSATTRVGGKRFLLYGWPNSVATFDITQPLRQQWQAEPCGPVEDCPNPQPLPIPTPTPSPPGFLYVADKEFRTCIFEKDNHAFLTEHLKKIVTVENYPIAAADLYDWGWDFFRFTPEARFLYKGQRIICSSSHGGIVRYGGPQPEAMFRHDNKIYLVFGKSILLIDSGDGAITPETVSSYSDFPVISEMPISFTNISDVFIIERADGRFAIVEGGGIAVVDLTDVESPVFIADLTNSISLPIAVSSDGNVLYHPDKTEQKLRVFDIASINNPYLINTIPWGEVTSDVRNVTMSFAGALLVMEVDNELHLFSVSNPVMPVLLSGQTGITTIEEVCYAGDTSVTSMSRPLAFVEGGIHYFVRNRMVDGTIIKVDDCALYASSD